MNQQHTVSSGLVRSLDGLIEILRPLKVTGSGRPYVGGINHDSRSVKPGDVFVAIAGLHTDGARHVDEALSRGAIAVVSEKPLELAVPCLQVECSRPALSEAAAWFHGYPSRHLKLTGVTGTNGKTTTCYLIKSILDHVGVSTGLIGSVANCIGSRRLPSHYTTPDPPELHSLLAEMVAARTERAVMEVSSHALAQERVASCRFDAVIFTNLTHDHLDFHKNFDNYKSAKGKLFRALADENTRKIINYDDPFGRELISGAGGAVITYGFGVGADIRAEDVELGANGAVFTLCAQGLCRRLTLPLLGAFNVYNALAAIAFALSAGVGLDPIAEALAGFPGVPGRQQPIVCGQPFSVYVDYAHTPDGLDQVLKAMRAVTRSRLLTVFGCTGDRDVGKRPIMGEIAARWSDFIFITSDDPHNENPSVIIDEIARGVSQAGRHFGADYLLEVDRAKAIEAALCMAAPGDVVLIAGKGHETYQEVAGVKRPFDDLAVAREALEAMPC